MAQSEGRLAPAISDDIISFYVVHGATVQGSSSVGDTIALSKIDNGDLMLRTGRKIKPPIIKGLVLPQRDDENMHFIINRGDSGYNDEATKKLDYQYLSDYFYTSLVVKDDFQWVNLSAYEADRMLPPELSGTAMGRNLLSQDCMLKRLTASLMHPDSEVGREYWDAVYAEARRLFGTSKLPFRSFHKVTILPIDALIYTPTDAASLQETLSITVPPNASFAYVIRNELGVLCEEDLVAKKYGAGASSSSGDVDFTLELFRKIVLPKIKEEVNEGEHFSEIRRIYSAMLLAAWLKREPQRSKNETIRQLVDSGKTSTRFTITGVKPLHHDKANSEQSVSARKEAVTLVEHVTPNASAFEIPENVEFYAQYIRLFKDGVFRCARNETGDTPDESVIRVYFSGAIDFRNLSEVVKFVRT
jgi:hypothetical protein